MSFFTDLKSLFETSLTPGEMISNLLVAFLCGAIIAWVYRKTYRGPGYLNSYINALVLLAMITSIVIMVIGNNLARAFGLVGAMSIIRFRTAVKDTQDIVFIFFSLAIGMAAGVGLAFAAFGGTIIVSLVAFALNRLEIVSHPRREYLLQMIMRSGDGDGPPAQNPLLERFCRDYKLVNLRSIDEDGLLEMSYYIKLRKEDQAQEFSRALKRLDEVMEVNLFFDEEKF